VRFCDTERDHVPPRGIFPKPWPDNFMTVRCCEPCHRNLSDGDEILKVLAGLGLVRSDTSQRIKPDVDRALSRHPWWKSSLVESAMAATPIEINYGAIRDRAGPTRPRDYGDVLLRRVQFGGVHRADRQVPTSEVAGHGPKRRAEVTGTGGQTCRWGAVFMSPMGRSPGRHPPDFPMRSFTPA
jgi:hypothetical protein